jgi:prepilin-type processing-associated H-X9-DG protein
VPGTSRRVFGYPAFEGAPEYGPARIVVVPNPAEREAIRDIDKWINGSAGWADRCPDDPAHGWGQGQAKRNYLFLDGHALPRLDPF